MVIHNFLYSASKLLLLGYSILTIGNLSAAIRHYQATPDNALWHIDKTTRLSCQLTHKIPAYGEAKFMSYASKSKPLVFNLDMLIRPDNYSIAQIQSIPPVWKPGVQPSQLATMTLLKQFDGEVDNATSWLMLSELEKGYTPTLYFQDWNNASDKIKVGLLSVNFRKEYLNFLECRDQMLNYSFDDIAFTVLNYESNSSELTKASKKRLNKIGNYLKNDPDIDSVLISGFTDSYGGRYLNETISKKRANAIKQFMSDLGVDQKRIKIAGFGEKRHIATNNTVIGRSKNRRVVIQIDKP